MNNKITPVSVLDYGYDEKGKLNETKVYSVHTDHLGTPKAITNKNQETVWQIDLDTFGGDQIHSKQRQLPIQSKICRTIL